MAKRRANRSKTMLGDVAGQMVSAAEVTSVHTAQKNGDEGWSARDCCLEIHLCNTIKIIQRVSFPRLMTTNC